MAGSVNKVILVGNLGADPEVRRTQDGRPIVNFRLATTDTWRDRQSGERREKTEWHQVVVFNEALAKVCEQYLKKGMRVYVEGALQTRSWEDQQGQKRYTTEVVLQNFNSNLLMLDGRGGSGDVGGSDFGGGGGDDYGSSPRTQTRGAVERGSSTAAPSRGSSAGRPSAPAFANSDMDDEIPF
jgi:single-strand DNA-binding protein